MGDIAEAMLDGTLCNVCGVYLGDGPGYPGTCPGCAGGVAAPKRRTKGPGGKRPTCPECQRQFNTRQGLADHRRDVHGAGGAPVSNKLIGQRMEARGAMLILDRAGIPFRTSNNGIHIQINTVRGMVDYWPTTGRWHLEKKQQRGDLMEFLRGVKYMRQGPPTIEQKGKAMQLQMSYDNQRNRLNVMLATDTGVPLLAVSAITGFFSCADLREVNVEQLATNWPVPIPGLEDGTLNVYPQDYLDKCADLRAVAAELDRLGVPAGTVAERMALFRERADELMQAEVEIQQVDAALDEARVPKVMQQESEDEDSGGNLVSVSETVPANAADRVSMLARMASGTPVAIEEAKPVAVNVFTPDGYPVETMRLVGPSGHVTINVTVSPIKEIKA